MPLPFQPLLLENNLFGLFMYGVFIVIALVAIAGAVALFKMTTSSGPASGTWYAIGFGLCALLTQLLFFIGSGFVFLTGFLLLVIALGWLFRQKTT